MHKVAWHEGVFALALAGTLALGPWRPTQREARDEQAVREHGRYLVEHVAMCVQCHTPRDERGELLVGQLFEGAAIPLESPFPDERWAFRAPALAGLPGLSDEELVRLLTSGVGHDGTRPAPPMPPFRLHEPDARAIASYLRSLR